MLRVTVLLLLALILTTPAAAQPAPTAVHAQSLGAAAHWALPYSGRGDKPGIQVTWRRWFSPRLGVGTDVRRWAKSTTIEFAAQPEEGRDVIAPARRRDDRRVSSSALSLGVLTRTSIGRLSLIGGAGPGFFVERSSHETRVDGVHDAARSTQRSIGVHALAEVDVRAASRLFVFAGLRIELRDVRFPESSSGYPTAGLRFAF